MSSAESSGVGSAHGALRTGSGCRLPGCNRGLPGGYSSKCRICPLHLRSRVLDMGDGRLRRFCQQCSRIQPLEDFDGDKLSCRAGLARHSELRRERWRQQRMAQQAGGQKRKAATQGSGSEGSQPLGPEASQTTTTLEALAEAAAEEAGSAQPGAAKRHKAGTPRIFPDTPLAGSPRYQPFAMSAPPSPLQSSGVPEFFPRAASQLPALSAPLSAPKREAPPAVSQQTVIQPAVQPAARPASAQPPPSPSAQMLALLSVLQKREALQRQLDSVRDLASVLLQHRQRAQAQRAPRQLAPPARPAPNPPPASVAQAEELLGRSSACGRFLAALAAGGQLATQVPPPLEPGTPRVGCRLGQSPRSAFTRWQPSQAGAGSGML